MDDKRKQLNAQRVQKMHVLMRPNILAIIADMEGAGWQPRIDVGVYRTPAEQARKVAQGYSHIYYSYHNTTSSEGEAQSEAADIVDVRYQWEPPKEYWLQLAAAAENQGLETGIYWYLPQSDRNRIHRAIAQRDWKANLSLGGDTAHVQPPQSSFTTHEARQGYRFNPGAVKTPIISIPPEAVYKLLGSIGNVMDTLTVYDGTAYVSARKWSLWFGVDLEWDSVKKQVSLSGTDVTTKVLSGVGLVPVREAAKATGLQLEVDNAQRTITLSR